jgi:prolyl oligopeptidase
MSEDGKESSEVIIIDVASKYIYPQVVTHLEPTSVGQIKWLEDNKSFFYTYFPVIDPSSTEYTKNTEVTFYRLGKIPKSNKCFF